MASTFEEKLPLKTNQELEKYLKNQRFYREEVIEAINTELKNRGLYDLKKEPSTKPAQELSHQKEAQGEFESKIHMPKSIHTAAMCLYISAVLGIINPIIIQRTHQINYSHTLLLLAAILFSSVLTSFFAYQISIGKNWARIIILILFTISLPPTLFFIPESLDQSIVIGLMLIAQPTIQLYSIILLFNKTSNDWYQYSNEEIN
ncbi:hypothetical protein [Reichenbachiella versicolor]|uniref:hypothetical protein n=1 Tax=Reichenbachiella versicolor TaxID=1821036 RepID=UPI000D6DC696|nr:hypothetical protein [Reichenbachiella versicolor]